MVLDLYGSNHDPAHWTDPEAFRPERFSDGSGDPFGLIPRAVGMRRPVTVALAKGSSWS